MTEPEIPVSKDIASRPRFHTEARATFENLMCDKCKNGAMIHVPMTRVMGSLLRRHKCSKCGHEEDLIIEVFPRVEFKNYEGMSVEERLARIESFLVL